MTTHARGPSARRRLLLAALLLGAAACRSHEDPAPAPPQPSGILQGETALSTNPPGASRANDLKSCADGATLYMVWEDDRLGDEALFFNASFDGGQTWLPQDVEIPGSLSADDADAAICCNGNDVLVVWNSQGAASGSDLYSNRSVDGGLTWEATATRVDHDATGSNARIPELARAGQDVYLCWQDDRNGSIDVYFNRSSDGGATWQLTDVRIDTDSVGGDSEYNQIRVDGNLVAAVWRDDRNGSADVYVNCSLDGGVTWRSDDVRVDSDAPGASDSLTPELVCSGGTMYVFWRDKRDDDGDLYFDRSTDGGNTWLPADVRIDRAAAGFKVETFDIAVSGSTLYAVYEQDLTGTFAEDLFLNRSTDGGSTWLPADIRVDDTPPNSADVDDPKVCADGQTVLVVYSDDRNGGEDVFLAWSLDGGDAWTTERVDEDAPGAADSRDPRVGCSGNDVWVVWEDERDGEADIYFRSGTLPVVE